MSMRDLGFIVIGALLLSACGNQMIPKITTDPSYTQICSQTATTNKTLNWTTSGGGDIQFSIVENANCQFSIHVTQYLLQPIDRTITLTASSDAAEYLFVSQVFSGYAVLQSSGSSAIGSYTTIGMTASGSTATYSNPVISGDTSDKLSTLYQYITANL